MIKNKAGPRVALVIVAKFKARSPSNSAAMRLILQPMMRTERMLKLERKGPERRRERSLGS